ncbi:MAG: IgGFc-binding protein [Myxococcales bacterium]|nr:IgGFc-binding protein [Myxococcales bacterium]
MTTRTVTPPASRPLGTVLVALAIATVPGACHEDPPPGMDGDGTGQTTQSSVDSSGTGEPVERCDPGEQRCRGQGFIETCDLTGLSWSMEPCDLNEQCVACDENDDTCTVDRCIGPCDVEAELPSSAGCSFIANRALHVAPENPDGLIVANPNEDLTATVQLYQVPEGSRTEEPVDDPVVLAPLESTVFPLDTDFVLGTSSFFRTGGVFRVESDVPVVAYLHGPLAVGSGNDSSLLLPETTAGQTYVAITYAPHAEGFNGDGEPSWFEVVALEDFTTITWTPPVNTAGTGINIGFVEAGTTSPPLPMNRFDTARIAASEIDMKDPDLRDLSGTVIRSDKPIMVWSGNRCSRVPIREMPETGNCDPLQELVIPLAYWGERYVAAASPRRQEERHYWRVFSGATDVTVTTEPQVLTEDACANTGTRDGVWDGSGCLLPSRGSYLELSVAQGTHFFVQGDGPGNQPGVIMPVQYLQSSRREGEPVTEATIYGDPAMSQSVPVEQFLKRYVFSTAVGYPLNFVQVIRERGGPAVYLDNGVVSESIPEDEFVPVNATYEVANHPITEGTYIIESGVPFGIVQMGWTTNEPNETCYDPVNPNPKEPLVCFSSYAYPGGMKSEQIYIP